MAVEAVKGTVSIEAQKVAVKQSVPVKQVTTQNLPQQGQKVTVPTNEGNQSGAGL